MTITEESARALAAAILLQAVRDASAKDKVVRRDIRSYLKTEWFEMMCEYIGIDHTSAKEKITALLYDAEGKEEMEVTARKCPQCGGITTVYNSKQKQDGRIIRYRKCMNCDARYTTEEKFSHYLARPNV